MTDLPAYTSNHIPPRPRLSIGQSVQVRIYGVPGSLAGEVVSIKPVKARIVESDPIWFGSVVSRADAKIRAALGTITGDERT